MALKILEMISSADFTGMLTVEGFIPVIIPSVFDSGLRVTGTIASSSLWKLRIPIFGWGTAQVVLCTVVIAAVARAFGIGWKTALVAALGLSLSSTAIALQVMNERNTLPTSAGQNIDPARFI